MIKLIDILEGKFDIRDTKDFIFVTYGGLSATKQHGFTTSGDDKTFHQPPARKGIYAFVFPYIERFLLGGYNSPRERGKGQRNRVVYVRDKDGNVIDSNHPEYEKQGEKNKNWHLPYWKDKTLYRQDVLTKNNRYNVDYVSPDKHVLYNHVQPKRFKYNGDIWCHLKEHIKPHLIKSSHGSWVKVDMQTFKDAFKLAIIEVDKQSYSMDHLEVFIENKI